MSHHIEERSVVYLRLEDDGTWGIDPVSADGYGLFGYDDGALNEACECDDSAGCAAAVDAANEVELPTLRELFVLIKKYYGEV